MASKRSLFEGQLGFFDEPKPDPTAALSVGARWMVVKSQYHSPNEGKLYLPYGEVVIRRFGQFNVTFSRATTPQFSIDNPTSWAQWCLALDDFFAMTRRIE